MNVLNKTNVRYFTLKLARLQRPAAGFTRISGEFVERLERDVRNMIAQRVHAQPSNGKTIR